MAVFFAESIRIFISVILGISILITIILISPLLLAMWMWGTLSRSPARESCTAKLPVWQDPDQRRMLIVKARKLKMRY